MEHIKNIAAGLVGMAVIAAAIGGVWWFGSNYPRTLIAITATPFFTIALWGFGRSLRNS